MAFVRTRGTTTALVEAYRDEEGRPRQRVLANLHGEPDALSALAKLAARREVLRTEHDKLAAEAVDADKFYETVTLSTLHGHAYSADERKEIDGLMKARERLLKRLEKIAADLAVIQRDGAVIRKHCAATADQVQAAIRAFKKKLRDAECAVWGAEHIHRLALNEAKAKLRRLGR